MGQLTPQGFVIRNFSEIRDAILARAQTDEFFGRDTNFDSSPDSIMGILAGIVSASLLEHEELQQSVYDQFNRDKAEGKKPR